VQHAFAMLALTHIEQPCLPSPKRRRTPCVAHPPPTRCAGVAVVAALALALLAALAAPAGACVQRDWTDETIEMYAFPTDRNAAAGRARLNAKLSQRVDEINRYCQLTEAQKAKPLLAGGTSTGCSATSSRSRKSYGSQKLTSRRHSSHLACRTVSSSLGCGAGKS
jgi:hypothetical protein